MICQEIPSDTRPLPVLIVGAGPAGIVQALELRRHGVEVVMLAGGADGFDPQFQDLADAEIADPRRHAPMRIAVRRALGGTSLLWGGRCVPFDDIDFADRPHVPLGGWPLTHDDIRPWYRAAMGYLNAGPAEFSVSADTPAMPDCRIDRLERWSEGRNLRRLHAAALTRDPGLGIVLGATATRIEVDPVTGRIDGVCVGLASGRRTTMRARAVVLACGGLETTRLMLASRLDWPRLFGGAAGWLGRAYMGHFEGRIADIVFEPGPAADAFDFFVDASGRYARRRITISGRAQQRHRLLNMAAWPDNPLLADPTHRSAILSLAYLSLATPGLGRLLEPEAIRRKYLERGADAVARHLANVLADLPEAARETLRFLWRRYIGTPRLPGFFIRNKARRYALFYHAEQAPNLASTVSLTGVRDALGMPRLKIDLRYSDEDARSVIAGHEVIDRDLRAAGIGRLEHHFPAEERAPRVWDQMTDGYHQIGTIRMARDPKSGSVDRDCRVHGTPNLFVAGSAVFPTSGQANPTLLIAALSARLAAHVARHVRELPEPAHSAALRRPAVMPSFTTERHSAPQPAAG
ncbi:MAG: GMC family oxidoreductase [Alphaproteobacteria bacterium]|nr:GMC family oxidoreductase [Alphaproteobacteria bacterium]